MKIRQKNYFQIEFLLPGSLNMCGVYVTYSSVHVTNRTVLRDIFLEYNYFKSAFCVYEQDMLKKYMNEKYHKY